MTTTEETVDQRFERHADRLRTLYKAFKAGEATPDEMNTVYAEMVAEDPYLATRWDNCIDGCCPTGELLLLRLVDDRVSADMMVRIFPEMIRSSQTHRAVITSEDTE